MTTIHQQLMKQFQLNFAHLSTLWMKFSAVVPTHVQYLFQFSDNGILMVFCLVYIERNKSRTLVNTQSIFFLSFFLGFIAKDPRVFGYLHHKTRAQRIPGMSQEGINESFYLQSKRHNAKINS